MLMTRKYKKKRGFRLSDFETSVVAHFGALQLLTQSRADSFTNLIIFT